MGGVQAILSLALVSGPLLAGAAFDGLGAPAPYFIGAVLSALAVPAVALSPPGKRVLPEPETNIEVPGSSGVPGKT